MQVPVLADSVRGSGAGVGEHAAPVGGLQQGCGAVKALFVQVKARWAMRRLNGAFAQWGSTIHTSALGWVWSSMKRAVPLSSRSYSTSLPMMRSNRPRHIDAPSLAAWPSLRARLAPGRMRAGAGRHRQAMRDGPPRPHRPWRYFMGAGPLRRRLLARNRPAGGWQSLAVMSAPAVATGLAGPGRSRFQNAFARRDRALPHLGGQLGPEGLAGRTGAVAAEMPPGRPDPAGRRTVGCRAGRMCRSATPLMAMHSCLVR